MSSIVFYIPAAIVLYFSIFGFGMMFGARWNSRNAKQEIAEKSKRSLSSLKSRFAYEKLVSQNELDGAILDEEEFEMLVEEDEERTDYMERQSRKFVECALNLMAHSYEDWDRAKKDVAGMFEMAFEEDILKYTPSSGKDNGGKHESV
jgi:hypothetical protein